MFEYSHSTDGQAACIPVTVRCSPPVSRRAALDARLAAAAAAWLPTAQHVRWPLWRWRRRRRRWLLTLAVLRFRGRRASLDAVPRSRCWHRCSPALGAPRHSLLAGRGTDSGELRAPPPPSEPTRTERGRAPGEAGCAPREVRAAGVAARAAPGGRLHQDGTSTLQPRRRAAAAIRAVLRRAAGPSAAPRMVQDGAAATSGRASTLPRDEEHRPGAARRGKHGAGAPRNAA